MPDLAVSIAESEVAATRKSSQARGSEGLGCCFRDSFNSPTGGCLQFPCAQRPPVSCSMVLARLGVGVETLGMREMHIRYA